MKFLAILALVTALTMTVGIDAMVTLFAVYLMVKVVTDRKVRRRVFRR